MLNDTHRLLRERLQPQHRQQGLTTGQSTPPAPPPEPESNPLSNDVLGCVFRFIQDHVHDENMLPLKDSQILRSWNSAAIAPQTSEYCILTHTGSVRHGTNVYAYRLPEEGDMGICETAKFLEHFIQVDFFCSDQSAPPDLTRRRAQVLELLANSQAAPSIFSSMNERMTCLYADNVQCFNEVDEAHRMRQRHTLTLHTGEHFAHGIPQRYISGVELYLTEAITSTNIKDITNGGTT